eukprot:TRINITY_DN14808_c0_g1_i1.p1 TRINITY_DN14808_c0_g1~~TRINITY_DN14808_c0_g1_i1.p1  ORF type:complete len:121 (-),score=9.77 TRINITY_DN14808_c0_g1_i1:300-662(-)
MLDFDKLCQSTFEESILPKTKAETAQTVDIHLPSVFCFLSAFTNHFFSPKNCIMMITWNNNKGGSNCAVNSHFCEEYSSNCALNLQPALIFSEAIVTSTPSRRRTSTKAIDCVSSILSQE